MSERSQWQTVEGLRVHARAAVDAAPPGAPEVVLVHGVGVSSRYMARLVRTLSGHCRVFAPDLPGFGQSENPGRVLGIEGLADALAGYVEAAGIRRPVILANSMGCQVAVEYAARPGCRASALVLVAPTADATQRTYPRQLLSFVRLATREPLPLLRVLAQDYLKAGIARTFRTYRDALRHRTEARIASVQVPVLVIAGSRDTVVSRTWGRMLSERAPRGRLAVMTGAAHAIHFENPEAVAKVMVDFVAHPPPARR